MQPKGLDCVQLCSNFASRSFSTAGMHMHFGHHTLKADNDHFVTDLSN